MMAGAEALITQLEAANLPGVRVERAPCMGACDKAPACAVGHRQIGGASVEAVRTAAAAGPLPPDIPAYQDLRAYQAAGGYQVLQSCLSGGRSVDDIITTLSDGGLSGLGGAGFPTGRKWGIVRGYPGPRLMAVNADEGEPGTFKDRHFLETSPHQFLEGLLIAAWAVEAGEVYIYLRDEYPAANAILSAELPELAEAGLSPHTRLHLRRGAGAYICGEE
jgi:formate dehydrogenase